MGDFDRDAAISDEYSEALEARVMNKEKQAYDYHSRMMNIQLNNESKDAEIQKDRGYEMMYKVGHRDARHVAEKIAIEADQEIAVLKAEIERTDVELRRALILLKAGHKGLAMQAIEQALQTKEVDNG